MSLEQHLQFAHGIELGDIPQHIGLQENQHTARHLAGLDHAPGYMGWKDPTPQTSRPARTFQERVDTAMSNGGRDPDTNELVSLVSITPLVLPKHGPHGEHYAEMGIQPLEVIEAWGLGWNLGSVVKYLARPEGQTIADLEKAVFYLQRELDTRRKAAL